MPLDCQGTTRRGKLISIQRICGDKVSFDRAKEKDLSTLQLLPSLCENKAGGIGARKLTTRRLTLLPGAMSNPHAAFFNWRQGGNGVRHR